MERGHGASPRPQIPTEKSLDIPDPMDFSLSHELHTTHLLLPKVNEVLQIQVIPVVHDGTIDDLTDLPTCLQQGQQ